MHSKNNCLYKKYLYFSIIPMHHMRSWLEIFKTESVSYGREHAKKNIRHLILLFIIGIAASGIASSFSPGENIHNMESFISDMLNFFVAAIMAVVSTRVYLEIAEGKGVNFNHFKLNTRAKRRMIAKWIWGYILYTLIIIWGLILLIIPGIYFAMRLSFWQYYLIDQKMGVMDSIRASWKVTKWHERQLIGIWLMSLGIIILWILALIVGVLWAVPTVKIAYANLYKKIAH